MRFHRTTLSDLQGLLPSLQSAEAVGEDDSPDFELLVCVNGFEDRTSAVPQWLVSQGRAIPTSILLHYPSNAEDNRRTIEALNTALETVSQEVRSIEFGIAAPLLRNELYGVAETASSDGRVRILLDISGASGRIVLRVVRSLFEFARSGTLQVELTIAYAEANEYGPSQVEAKQLIEADNTPGQATLGLDFDAEELSPSVEYPGQHIEHVPDRAIVICGFNADRARASLDHIDTAFNIDAPHSRVTYIAGHPPREADQWRLEAMTQINSHGIADPINFHVTSTLHYEATLEALESRYQESFGHERITVLPFGSKMQTLAVALFCEMHPDVKVQMLAPARYAGANYSKGHGEVYFLRFGDLRELSGVLSRIGQLVEV